MALKTRDTRFAFAPGLRNVPPSTNMMARDTRAMLFVGCWPDAPVAPGKPFSISWQIWSVNAGPNLGDVYAQIYLDGQLVHTTPSVTFVTQKWGGDTGLQDERNIVPPADPKLRAALYKLGTQTLELRAVANGPDAKKFDLTTSFDLDVQPSFAPASDPQGGDAQALWDMDCAPDQVNYVHYHFTIPIDWGSKYALKATVLNTGMAGLAGDFHLHTVSQNDPGDQHDSGLLNVQGSQAYLIPGQTGTLVVKNVAAEKFIWFSPVGYFPLERQGADHVYTWSIVSHLRDEFGNVYPEQNMALLAVTVRVQNWKFDLILAAMPIVLVGAALLLLPWPVDAVGAALIVVATALALAALDPPEPSPRYRQKVRIAPQPVPKELLGNAKLAPFAELVDVVNRIVAAHWALTETHSRLLGAREAGHAEGEALQVDGYRGGIDYLTGAVARLQPAIAAVAAAEGMDGVLRARAFRGLLDSVGERVSPARRRAWTRAGASQETQAHAAKLLQDPRFRALTKNGVGPLLGLISPALVRYANRRRAEAPAILTGSARALAPATVVEWRDVGVRTRA